MACRPLLSWPTSLELSGERSESTEALVGRGAYSQVGHNVLGSRGDSARRPAFRHPPSLKRQFEDAGLIRAGKHGTGPRLDRKRCHKLAAQPLVYQGPSDSTVLAVHQAVGA